MKHLPVIFIFLFLTTGCVFKDDVPKPGALDATITEQLMLAPNQSQNAIFQVAYTPTEGFGQAIINQQTGDVRTIDNKLLYVDSHTLKREIKKQLPGCIIGEPRILVSAAIIFEPRKKDNQEYFEAVIDEVFDVNVFAEACPS